MKALEEHPWWGNLRELRNCMERLALTVPGPKITHENVQTFLHHRPGQNSDLLDMPIKELEKQAILISLERHGGNRTRAAAALGIGRRTLQNKLKAYRMAEETEPD